jgi:N-acetylmuramic acid 6-phosphate (MurNAc-6-P) etherase
VDAAEAQALLATAGDSCKIAIVIRRKDVNADQARELLDAAGGNLRTLLEGGD